MNDGHVLNIITFLPTPHHSPFVESVYVVLTSAVHANSPAQILDRPIAAHSSIAAPEQVVGQVASSIHS
jgi:hypothetical protein